MAGKHRPRAYTVSMFVYAPADATIETVRSLLMDLQWVGGCRDPENDPAFDSLKVGHVQISRAKLMDKKS